MVDETASVKKLRDKTGAGYMNCRRALQATGWDIEKAVDHLRKEGAKIADKKRMRTTNMGKVEAYIHGGGRIGTLVEINCETDFVARTEEFSKFVKDVAMQVAASAPTYVERSEVPEDVIQREKGVLEETIKDKPANVVEKIVKGKLDKFYQEICLLEQPYIKDDKVTIQEYLTQTIAKVGENIRIRRFSRYVLGDE